MTQTRAFGDRLGEAFAVFGRLCVGVDPHPHLVHEWGLPDTAAGAGEFGARVVEAAAGSVGIVKPQVAFFERFGAAGYAALERVIGQARAAGLLVIADAKRGDIGSTVEAYGEAWLRPGSPLEADAMTIAAFQGVGSIAGVMARAERDGKGLFVLAATSNPEAAAIQTAVVTDPDSADRRTVARVIIDDVTAFNRRQPAHTFGSIGVVLGATVDLAGRGVETAVASGVNAFPILAPGFGHQGARLQDASRTFGALAGSIIVSESRGVLAAGPGGIAQAIRERAGEVRNAVV